MLGNTDTGGCGRNFREVDELLRPVRGKEKLALVGRPAMDHDDGGPGNRFPLRDQDPPMDVPAI